jgi:hypothetical protein
VGASPASAPVAAEPAQPAARQPTAVQPGLPVARPVPKVVPAETPPPNPGDLICGNCGIGNDPARKFCRRCGTSLAEAVVATVRIPWWRRIFRRRAKKPLAAGERPKSMRADGSTERRLRPGRLLSLAFQIGFMIVVVGAVVGYAVSPAIRDGVSGVFTSIRKIVAPQLVVVNTASKATGPAITGHAAQAAFDGNTLSYWAATFDAAKPPAITAGFSPPADVDKVLLRSGAAGAFQDQPRPKAMKVEFRGADGSVVASKTIDLQDSPDLQVFDISAAKAASVRFTVTDVYISPKGKAVSITEIEFNAKQ